MECQHRQTEATANCSGELGVPLLFALFGGMQIQVQDGYPILTVGIVPTAAADPAEVAFADTCLQRSGDPSATMFGEMHTVDLWAARLALCVVEVALEDSRPIQTAVACAVVAEGANATREDAMGMRQSYVEPSGPSSPPWTAWALCCH